MTGALGSVGQRSDGTEGETLREFAGRRGHLFCVSRPTPGLLGSTASDILVSRKTAKASAFSVCRHRPERKPTGRRSSANRQSVTRLKGPYLSPLLLSFAGDKHRPQTPVPFFSLPFFFFNHFPTVTSRGCCLPRRPRKDSVTFIPSSILRGAPIKPFRRGGSVRMLPPRASRSTCWEVI